MCHNFSNCPPLHKKPLWISPNWFWSLITNRELREKNSQRHYETARRHLWPQESRQWDLGKGVDNQTHERTGESSKPIWIQWTDPWQKNKSNTMGQRCLFSKQWEQLDIPVEKEMNLKRSKPFLAHRSYKNRRKADWGARAMVCQPVRDLGCNRKWSSRWMGGWHLMGSSP